MPEEVMFQAKCELAKRFFWDYCLLKAPDFYKKERFFLKDLCYKLQDFMSNDKKILVINMPPRHGKSRTATLFTQWLLGNNPKLKVMTGSYNETLSSSFAKQVRDSISETDGVFSCVFPNVGIKYGEAAMNKWALKGNEEANYLATSPTGIATGFGCNVMIIDDTIKNAEEAYNDNVLEKILDWFKNTMLSRTENNFKIIIIMTRWATKDLAGYILENYNQLEVEHICYKAVLDNGNMLCDEILTKADYTFKTRDMNEDIVLANYQQEAIDIKNRLYKDLMEWEKLPNYTKVYSLTDTADTGEDYLVTIPYIVNNGDVYILDIQYDDKPMEATEDSCTEILINNNVTEAEFEGNNGGRGFARNIDRKLREKKYYKCVIKTYTQTKNKEARILSSAAWICNHVYFPLNWKTKYKEAYKSISTYQRKGKNKHDDIEDVLAGIYERVANKPKISIGMNSII